MRVFIKHILTLALVVGIGYFIFNYSGPVKDKFSTLLHLSSGSVKGASTQKAKAISNQISSDIGNQLNGAKNQVLNIKVSDLMNVFSRLQKIPRDINGLQNYIKDQIGNVTQKKQASISAR